MGKIVDKTETKIVTLDGVEIIKQVTKVLMSNGKYRYPTVYFTVNDDVKALTAEQLDKIRIPVSLLSPETVMDMDGSQLQIPFFFHAV